MERLLEFEHSIIQNFIFIIDIHTHMHDKGPITILSLNDKVHRLLAHRCLKSENNMISSGVCGKRDVLDEGHEKNVIIYFI